MEEVVSLSLAEGRVEFFIIPKRTRKAEEKVKKRNVGFIGWLFGTG